MRKLFTMLVASVMALAGMATTTFTGTLTVTINGELASKDVNSKIEVDKDGDFYSLSVNNFMFSGMPIGTIKLTGIEGNTKGYVTSLYVNQSVTISAGDAEGVDFWMGPLLGSVPLQMFAYFDSYENHNNYLSVDIDIDMVASLGQVIKVHFENAFDSDFSMLQHENSDFESWASGTNPEPTGWSGFKNATGGMQSMIKAQTYLSKGSSSEAHGGSACAKVSSYKYKMIVLNVYANGTFTNGRLNAGSATADDASGNYSYMESSSSDYYHEVLVAPDAISAWMKLNSTVPTDNPANLSVILFDGTRYQDPESDGSNKENVAAKAQDKTSITRRNGYDDWKQDIVPFTYTDVDKAKAILITFSTSSTPGGLSSSVSGETLYVDDIELHYYNRVTDIKFNGTQLAGFSEDTHEYSVAIGIDVVVTEDNFSASFVGVSAVTGVYVTELPYGVGYKATVYAISPKMEMNQYVITLNRPITALADVLDGETAKVIVADDLAIVKTTEDGDIYAADSDNNWVRLSFSDETVFENVKGKTSISGGTLVGNYTADALDPNINVLTAGGSSADVDYEIAQIDLATHKDGDPEFSELAANQVVEFTGYYFDGKLRGLQATGAKGQSLDLDVTPMGLESVDDLGLVEGGRYKITAAVTFHEAWNGAPRKARSNYDYDFQNVVAKVLAEPETITITGVEDINSEAEVVSTRYYNVAGQQVAAPVDGVNIVVTTLSDGTVKTAKVLK